MITDLPEKASRVYKTRDRFIYLFLIKKNGFCVIFVFRVRR